MDMKDTGDLIAGSTVIATMAGWLPSVAAILAIVWTGIRIYEWARVRIWKKPPDIKL